MNPTNLKGETANSLSANVNSKALEVTARVTAASMIFLTACFLLNNYLNFWLAWPGMLNFLNSGLNLPKQNLLGWLQTISYLLVIPAAVLYIRHKAADTLIEDTHTWNSLVKFIIRAAFWAVLLIGIFDSLISFLRIEGFLPHIVGDNMSTQLGRSNFRGPYLHFPLIGLSILIAAMVKKIDFFWLALMVVLTEFGIVISRFVFSYEQAFMGDLVRFWYAALFLFASAYTFLHDGHVRVDVLYGRFSKNTKAWANILGILFLGLPLCWIILSTGMWEKTSSIISPLVNYEITQSNYGLYVKYLMVFYLIIFAVTMIIQFCSYFLTNIADLLGQRDENPSTALSQDH
ncbi:TRAP transporter small permease subunit [Gynuella sp.]|uniref:TRAP transporter small permease subunit n=1 Tax=Gynuella sp. TaxID=2969146 RepID=UPI003D0C0737